MSAPEARQRLLDHLTALGIDAPIVDYPAHTTVEEGKALRSHMSGTFTKNLLFRTRSPGSSCSRHTRTPWST